MSRVCKTCTHPKREELEQDLLNSVPYRNIGAKYGISYVSICRHFENGHIAADLVRATEVKKIAYSDNLLEKLLYLQREALKILVSAKNPEEGKPLLNTALSAIGKVAGLLETQARLAGQLRELEINIAVNPHWLAIKQQIFTTLKAFPGAYKAMQGLVENGKLTDVQQRMIEPETISPAVLAIINREFEEEPEAHED